MPIHDVRTSTYEDHMQPALRRIFKLGHEYVRDKRGSVAVLFALSSVPILIASAVALDMSNASQIKSRMQAAADAGALAGATRLALNASDADKEDLALDTFYANIPDVLEDRIIGSPSVSIDMADESVRLDVTINAIPILGSVMSEEVTLGVTSEASVSDGSPICIMALNETVPEALSIQGTADLVAEDCAVHVNSGDNEALHHNGNATGTAESFCVHGGSSGDNFSPDPKEGCGIERDPLEDQFGEDWAAEDIDDLPCTYSNLGQINTGAGVVTNLAPGVYCGGLTIKKGIVQLQEGGMYVFRDGALHVQAHGQLKGTKVAILLDGNDSTRFITQSGAKVNVSARTSGKFKGIAIAQHPSSVPTQENLIIGGGEMSFKGMLYFPKQALKVTGGGDVGGSVAQFAIIADTIAIEGNGQVTLKVDDESSLPELARADEIVRLVR